MVDFIAALPESWTATRPRQARGWHKHFIGSWARLNCENMTVVPAWLVRSNLNDPRRIPYLLVLKDERDGEIKEAVRLAHFTACAREGNDYAELKRTDGSITFLRIVWRTLPRNGGRRTVPAMSLLRHPASSRLWLGVGQLFGLVKQGQADQLAMPLVRPAALLLRRRLSTSYKIISRFRKPATAGVVASLRVHLT